MSRPTGAVLRVADALIRRIVAEEYTPGLRLPSEVELSEEFGCGRSTVREALRYLAGLNLVQSRRGSGAVVLDYKREGGLELVPDYFRYGQLDHPLTVVVAEMLRIRKTLACEAARLAALYGRPDALASVRRQVESTHAVRDKPVDHALRELEVFRLLTQASAIWPSVWLANAFVSPMREVNRMVAGQLGGVPENWLQTMLTLLDLIEKKDDQGAVAHLARYYEQIDEPIIHQLAELFGR